jgi:hypothetical protein
VKALWAIGGSPIEGEKFAGKQAGTGYRGIMTEEVRQDVMKYFPDYPIDSDQPLPFAIYEWLVFKVWAPAAYARGEMTPEKSLADFMRNEGSQTEEWPDFGYFSDLPSSRKTP